MKALGLAKVLGLPALLCLAQVSYGAQQTLDEDVSRFRPHVGAVFGSLSPSNSLGDASLHYGVDMGFSPVDRFGVGLTLSYYGSTDQLAGATIKTALVPILVETSYHFSGASAGRFLDGFHIGTKQGLVFRDSTLKEEGQPTQEIDSTGFGFGPLLGYDYVVDDRLTIGGEMNYLFVLDDQDYQVFNILAAVKYWL